MEKRKQQEKSLIDGRHLENVEQFTYLGSNTTYDLDNMREVRTRLAKATAALKAMEKVWKSRSIEIETKKGVLKTCAFSIGLSKVSKRPTHVTAEGSID